MKKLISSAVLCSMLTLVATPAFAVEGNEVQLRATTLPGLTTGAVGRFDLTTPENSSLIRAAKRSLPFPGTASSNSSRVSRSRVTLASSRRSASDS